MLPARRCLLSSCVFIRSPGRVSWRFLILRFSTWYLHSSHHFVGFLLLFLFYKRVIFWLLKERRGKITVNFDIIKFTMKTKVHRCFCSVFTDALASLVEVEAGGGRLTQSFVLEKSTFLVSIALPPCFWSSYNEFPEKVLLTDSLRL